MLLDYISIGEQLGLDQLSLEKSFDLAPAVAILAFEPRHLDFTGRGDIRCDIAPVL